MRRHMYSVAHSASAHYSRDSKGLDMGGGGDDDLIKFCPPALVGCGRLLIRWNTVMSKQRTPDYTHLRHANVRGFSPTRYLLNYEAKKLDSL